MKLILNNFRCFKDTTIELPDKGTILLWGTSGIGKTTIFKAINFVLYGKEQKVVKHGEKKCKVVMHFKDIIITRTKVPNHLIFKKGDDEKRDDPAQHEIDKLFGKDFLLTSYMAQKGTENFFNLSSNEKSAFLQKLSLKDFDVEGIRRKVRDTIKQRKDKLLVNSTEYKMIKKELDEYKDIKEPKLKIDLKGKDIDETIENDLKLKEKTKKIIKDKKSELEDLKKTLDESVLINELIEQQNKNIESIKKRVEEYKNVLEFKDETDKLQLYSKVLMHYSLSRNFKVAKDEYDKMVEDEKEKNKKDILNTRNEIDSITILSKDILVSLNKAKQVYDKCRCKTVKDIESKLEDICIEDTEYEIEEYSKLLTENSTKLSKFQVEYESIKKSISDISSGFKKAHKCPKCKTSVYMDGDCLKELRDDPDEMKERLNSFNEKKIKIESDINSLNKTIKKINEKILSSKMKLKEEKEMIDELNTFLEVLKDDLLKDYVEKLDKIKGILDQDNLNKYKLKTLEEKLVDLHSNVTPNYLKKKKEMVLDLKKRCDALSEEFMRTDESVDEEEEWYESEVERIKNSQKIHEERLKIYTSLLKDKNKEEEKLENMKKKIENVCIDYIKTRIEEVKEIIIKKEETEDKLNLREVKLSKYKNELKMYNKSIEVKNRMDDNKHSEEILVRALSTSELLLKKINDAEAYSLQYTIDTINTNLEEFVSYFFDNNISVRLDSFKEGKEGDKKGSIEILVYQDGEQIPIDTLSGGEFDRLALALFLSFNKTCKSDIIMLDECLASLHSELVEDIVEMIKTKMGDKLVLFTLHQANTGIFDNVINVKEIREN